MNISEELKYESFRQGIQQGIDQGLQRGIKQGIYQGENRKAKTIAKKMHHKGFDLAVIQELTGLKEADLVELTEINT